MRHRFSVTKVAHFIDVTEMSRCRADVPSPAWSEPRMLESQCPRKGVRPDYLFGCGAPAVPKLATFRGALCETITGVPMGDCTCGGRNPNCIHCSGRGR